MTENLYEEPRDTGNPFRIDYLAQVQEIIRKRRLESAAIRQRFFNPDMHCAEAYAKSIEPLRQELRRMLGWPLWGSTPEVSPALPQESFVATDDLGDIFRLQIPVMPGLSLYGILFLPHHTEPPFRLVLSQHGGQGTPEITAGFFGSDNYNDMTRRLLRRGFAVFAPQLLLWNEKDGPTFDRQQIDVQLKQVGGSITALEIYCLQRALDHLLSRSDMIRDGAGMMGLSYGGFYTLFTAALDTRIQAAVSSCFVNDRFQYDWPDWTWFDAAYRFTDSEIMGLICPRAFYVELGDKDELFEASSALPSLEEARTRYEALGISESFQSKVFSGTHELDKSDEGIDFLCRFLAAV